MSDKLRYVATPLVTVDPFLSVWSMSDRLYDDVTRHWTERRNSMSGFVCVDGKWHRFMGTIKTDKFRCFADIKAIQQTNCEVYATKTVYEFENDIFNLKVIFRTPLLLDDLYLMSRPVSYISYEIEYKDGQKHNTKVYFDISAETCVNDTQNIVELGKTENSVYCGRGDKDVLSQTGDDILIDWGYLHMIAPDAECKVYDEEDRVDIFKRNNEREGIIGERRVSDGWPVLSATKSFGEVEKARGFVCIGYDDIYSIEYFGEKLKGYWTENGDDFDAVVKKAIDDYKEINEKCDKFDLELRAKGETISAKYADILSLSYRQVIAGHKLVCKDGKLLFFSKECGSNGCIGTVDVTYPSIPMFLYYKPELVEGMLNPVFDYAENDYGWKYEFSPHDVGQYPKSNGQVYGCESTDPEYILSHQMPIEECGNMLLCVAAICKIKNSAEYANQHFNILKKWADYLVNVGWNPENQLCTDDFAGHLAHNCNLSIKGILAIAAFGYICGLLGQDGKSYIEKAKEFAAIWEKEAFDENCYRLAFDKENTWSLKYNLVWDRFFGFEIFSEKVAKTEVDFYKTKFNTYGVPLDSREDYTKSDWQIWTACLTDDCDYLDMVIETMWKYVNETEDRIPFSDWYSTEGNEVSGSFRNRTVQGGLFMPLLFEKI